MRPAERQTRGVALLAIMCGLFASGGMSASGAQAEVTLTSGLTPSTHTAATVHAVQYETIPTITENSLTTVNAIHCDDEKSTFTGSAIGTNKTLTITPKYVHCTTITSSDTVGTPVTVTMNECDYLFNQPTTIAGTGEYTGTFNLVCPAGKKMEVEVYASGTVTAHATKICTIAIAEVKNISHVIYKNTAGFGGRRDDIDVNIAGSGIPYTTSGLCGTLSANGTLTSHLTLTSTSHDLWYSD